MNRSLSGVPLSFAISAFALVTASGGRANEITDGLRGLTPQRIAQETCSTRIVGGDCTSQSKWPWQVALYFRNADGSSYFRCGGSLVAPNRVLTAAHCFGGDAGGRAENWTVADNIDKLNFGGVPDGAASSAVTRVIVHERYQPTTQENDIAMLVLASPLSAATIDVQTSADPALEAGREATVTGWGYTRWVVQKKDDKGHSAFYDGETQNLVKPAEFLSPDLREAVIPLVDLNECEREYQPLNKGVVDARNLCAGLKQGGRDSCQGDSGGPLMAQNGAGQWRQIGVVSWGQDCARPGYAGIYTRTSAFGPWIQRNLSVESTSATSSQTQAASSQPAQSDAPQNPAELSIAFDKGDVVKVGDTVAYVATAKKAGYLAIFDATPDGKLTLVYPNVASLRSPTGAIGTTRLDPSKPMLVPNYKNQYRGFNVVVEEPRGEGVMVAVLSDEPLKDLQTPDAPRTFGRDAALSLVGRLHDELKARMAGARDGAEHPPWSVAMRKYTIR